MSRRLLALTLAAALALSLMPIGAAAAIGKDAPLDSDEGPGAQGVSAQLANYATPDIYEGPGDGVNGGTPVWGSTRDLAPLLPRWGADLPGWGIEPYTEQHTISTATAGVWDEDWYKLVVSTQDVADWPQLSYRVDAYAQDRDVDLCVDVYGTPTLYSPADTIVGGDSAALVSNDDSPWGYPSSYSAFGRWSSVTFIPSAAGTYWIRVRPYWNGTFAGRAGPYTLRVKVGQVMRLYGATRVDTAVRISQEGWPTMPQQSRETTVVLAYSNGYADALSAASLAGACGGPILLTPGDHLPAGVATEIKRIGAKGVYIVGGTGRIANTVIADLETFLPTSRVKRVSGSDRVLTSVEVMKETRKVLQQNGDTVRDVAFVASGYSYPDALAVSPMAYYNKIPILLTHKEYLDAAVASAIPMYGVDDVIVAGGTAAVSADTVGDIIDGGMPPNRIHRIAGSSRYETAKEVAAWACDLKGPGSRADNMVGTTNNTVALPKLPFPELNAYASGEGYADALAGGALAGKTGAPILLTPKAYSTPFLFGADGEIPLGSTQWFTDLATNSKLPIAQCYLLGGPGAVSDGAYLEIDNNTGWEP